MEPITVTMLPGRDFFTLSTDRGQALTDSQLREELAGVISRADIIDDIIWRAKQMR